MEEEWRVEEWRVEEASEEEPETQITAVSPDIGMRDLRRRRKKGQNYCFSRPPKLLKYDSTWMRYLRRKKKAKTIVLADHPNY